jgi:tRNA 5-methylaminomethyl-2-thiouridine biosynthesis bifunctional protein
MRSPANAPPTIVWEAGEVPASADYADVYFSRQGGLGEAQAVFLAGCGLPQAWAGRDHFCVGELGLGTGRNIAALLDLWRREGPAGARLSIFSVEAHLLLPADAVRALAAWPEVAEVARLLTDRWPRAARGFQRIDFPELRASLDVAVMDAAQALGVWSGAADAWFLDGFSPARNPQMWRPRVLELVRERSAPDARVATYSVAAQVRDGLAACGFDVRRAAGFGAKRERLEARLPGRKLARWRPRRLAIVGGGIAGAALRRAFAAQGFEARIFDAGGGASRGPRALAAPRLDAGLGASAELFAQSARRARALYETVAGAVTSEGALQLAMREADERRFAAIAHSAVFASDEVTLLSPAAVRSRLGEATSRSALGLERAVVVAPEAIRAAWAPSPTPAQVAAVESVAGVWRLLGEAGEILAEADAVCLAAGMGCAALAEGLPLTAVRGQATVVAGAFARTSVLFGGYVLPAEGGALIGATHARGDAGDDLRDEDDVANLAALKTVAPDLAERAFRAPRRGWAAVRATTTDYLPIVGRAPGAPEGLFVLAGLGSRGFCLAPLLAEHVAALALERPSPLSLPAQGLLSPARFHERAARRGRLAPARQKDPP